jgi:hypothetical protein
MQEISFGVAAAILTAKARAIWQENPSIIRRSDLAGDIYIAHEVQEFWG